MVRLQMDLWQHVLHVRPLLGRRLAKLECGPLSLKAKASEFEGVHFLQRRPEGSFEAAVVEVLITRTIRRFTSED